MRISIHPSPRDAATAGAQDLASRAASGELHVLGVATGSTPLPLDEEAASLLPDHLRDARAQQIQLGAPA